MAAINSTTNHTPFRWPGSGDITVYDGGGNSCTAHLIGSFDWTENGRAYVEIMERRRHQATPVLEETDDGTVEITISARITSMKGNSTVHLFEALRFTGAAASWTSVASGTKKALRLVATYTKPDGSTQTATFAACIPTSIAVTSDGEDGFAQLDATLVDHENQATIA